MHQTTIRFGPDLWVAIEQEADRLGISVAQYVRDAALVRLSYEAARRGHEDFEHALDAIRPPSEISRRIHAAIRDAIGSDGTCENGNRATAHSQNGAGPERVAGRNSD